MGKLFDIFQKRKQIFEGIMNTLFTSKDVEVIAAERMKICNSCPHLDRTGIKCFIPGTQPCCGICSCKLAWKLRSLSEYCPAPEGQKWEAILTPDEEAEINRKLDYDPYNKDHKNIESL